MSILSDQNRHKSGNSLMKEFRVFIWILIITVVLVTLWYGVNIYSKQSKRIISELEDANRKIERSLNYSLKYTQYIIEYVLNQINEKWNNLHYIDKILGSVKINSELNTILSWNMFTWLNEKNYIVVNSQYHIVPNPIDASSLSNLSKAKTNPGVLYLGKPLIGFISGQLVIPAAMSTIDRKGQHVGTLVVGLDVESIIKKLQDIISSENIKFLLLDADFEPIIYSNYRNIKQNNDIVNFLQKETIDKNKIVISYPTFFHRDKDFISFHKLEGTPYYLVLYYNKLASDNEIWNEIFIKLIESIFLSISLLAFLYAFKQKMLNPIIKLSNIAEKISKGETEVYIPENETKEINNLADNLREIQKVKKELYNTQSLLKDANKGLEDKVKERTAELVKALEVKTEFLNNISHEVRTPIHGVTAITQGIVDHWDDISELERREFAKQAAAAANRLFSLVNNILDLSKMTNNKMDLLLVNVELFNLAKEIVQESRELYIHNKKLVLIIVEPREKLPVLLIDKQFITQVFRNIITNAIKFTKEGKIEISFEKKNNQIQVQIKDEGIGIPKGEEKEIFSPFTQSSLTKTKAGGTGLGLAICKEIIEMHQGKIWAENNPDKGASFYFILPINMEKEENIKAELKVNILLIDDERICIESMKMMLIGSEFEVIGALGGVEGLGYLGANPNKIDLILLDMMMPDMYGLEVLEKLKNNPKFSNIPVILQTGLKKEDEIQKAYDMGIVNFIGKPYKKDEIIKILRSSIKFKIM